MEESASTLALSNQEFKAVRREAQVERAGTELRDLQPTPSYHVQGLDSDPSIVAAAKERYFANGSYGELAVDQLIGDQLPYVDNLVNLLIAEKSAGIKSEEILRVLAEESHSSKQEGRLVGESC
ncbi:MAG: hypothetical protein U0930_13565 [Pirellulales bacterium]